MKQSLCVKLILPLPIAFLFGYNAEMKPAEGIFSSNTSAVSPSPAAAPASTPLTPDGSTIQAGSGKSLTTSAGIFSFSNVTASWGGTQTLINGTSANNGYANSLEVDSGGQVYALAGSTWYLYSGSQWVITSAPPAIATISSGTVYQNIDGFGASDAQEVADGVPFSITTAEADLFFSQTKGIGLSLLRTWVPDDGSCATVSSACAGVMQSDMQMAVARGAKVWATPWSAPASMKSNNSLINGGSLLSQDYGAYAQSLSNFITSVGQIGISLYAISMQNEPNAVVPWDSMYWQPGDVYNFILNYLGPTLKANGQSGVELMMPETGCVNLLASYADPTLLDPSAAAYVGIIGVHDYCSGSGASAPYANAQGKPVWLTETSETTAWDPSISDGLKWAQSIHNLLVNMNVSAWHYWNLIGNNGAGYENEGLIFPDGTTSKRLYVLGNYSKFIRPGYQRIDATASPQGNVFVSAYKDSSSNNFAIVVINSNSSDTSQSFSFNGFTSGTVTPWVTSASFNLESQPSVTATNGQSFNYTLSAMSVTTFVGTAN